jgi:hypothetical protein
MAPVLKTGRAQALVGSNPTPSAMTFQISDLRLPRCSRYPANLASSLADDGNDDLSPMRGTAMFE